jgi:hypothetical protein
MDQANNDKSLLFAVVSKDEAKTVPYPYVYVNDNGTVRELHPSERSHLETPFHPADGARPYIKSSFDTRDGWGSISGFCLRFNIPSNIEILEPPLEDPAEASKKMLLAKQIMLAKEKGFEVIENADGTITMRRKPKS